jgi:hypothetical protein
VAAALQSAIGAWIKAQTKGSENEYGKPTKRGYFSRYFAPADGGAYHGTAHIETAGEMTKTTERYQLTLAREGNTWNVTGAEVRDTYAGMHRDTYVTCAPFVHLAASNGSTCVYYRKGRPNRFDVQASNGTYRYEPPDHAKNLHLAKDFHAIFDSIGKDHARELEFPPHGFLIGCDPDTCDELLKQQAPAWVIPLLDQWEKDRRENAFVGFTRDVPAGQRFYAVFVARELSPFNYPGTEEGFADFSGTLPGSGVQLA